MNDTQLSKRIILNTQVMGGKPTIKGTRLTVEFIVGLLAHGASTDEILTEYPGLSHEDIQACLLFASKSLAASTFAPLVIGAK